jgi:glutamyl-tRNA reductase
MVVGEYQIVAQVKEAFYQAQSKSTTGKILNRLFTKALEVGKQVRTRTGISRGAFSVSYAAVEKCREHFSNIEQRKILLVGAGETGELVVKNFHKRGSHQITIANRTPEKAAELASRYNAHTVPFEKVGEVIRQSEIVISSVTGEHLITPALLGSDSFDHKVMMIDLGVPRNISPDVADISHVKLLNIDDLQQVVTRNEERKKGYFDIAEDIISEKQAEFEDWLIGQKLSPAIRDIINSVHQLHSDGLESFKSSSSDEELEIMKSYGHHLSEKMIKTLIKNLKTSTENGRKEDVVEVVNRLFK